MSFDHRARRVRPGGTQSVFHPRIVLTFTCLALVLAASGTIGCGEPVSDVRSVSGDDPSGADSAGVSVVHNLDSDPSADPVWRVGEALRVGSVEGELAFGRVSDVAPKAGGGMWVLDGQSRAVFGIDESGAVTLTFGGQGEGPGEFRNPSGIVETTDGRIAVTEALPPVLHWFDADGGYRETVRVEAARDDAGTRSMAVFAQWEIGPGGTAFADVFGVPMPGAGPRVRHSIVRIDGEGPSAIVPDTIVRWSVKATPADPTAEVEIVPIKPQWAVGPGPEIWWTPGFPYELRAFEPGAGLTLIARLPRAAVPVTRDLKTAIESELRGTPGDGTAAAAAMESLLDRAIWPDALPHVAGLWVSAPDGRVFVSPFTESMFDEIPKLLLDVFEPDGRYSGSLELPPGFSPRSFADRAVYGVATDELGVGYAVRYRIQQPD